MNILVVHGQKLEAYPPVRSLIDTLTQNGHKVTLITKFKREPQIKFSDRLNLIKLIDNENSKSISSMIAYIRKKQQIRDLVVREMKNNDILWTTTDSTVRDLGNIVFKYKHIMQLMELIEDMPAFPGLTLPKMHIDKFARHAYKVVVPEYNRAQIQKVWWNLREVPTVFPNKMSSTNIGVPDDSVKTTIDILKKDGRKILLYQGSFKGDRDLRPFAEAAKQLKEEYILCLMGSDTPERVELCKQYPDIKYIPFISPPYHLLVSQCAYIGLLPYVPEKVGFNSELNALYCAPNKIFEFSGYGIPMIGNNVPGLKIPFDTHNIGYVRETSSVEEIIKLIRKIESNYAEMSNNCKKYYDSYDLNAILQRVLEE